MAGSHRAQKTQRTRERPGRRQGWAVAVAVVLALVPATWFGVHRLVASPTSAPDQTATDLPIPSVSPRATTPAPQPPATSAPPATPRPHLAKVAPEAPRRLQAGPLLDTGFDSAVSTIEPASTAEVARLAPRGSPGSPGTDTVVVVGKVLTGGEGAFGHLPQLRTGATVSIRTDAGTLTYTVVASARMPVSGLASSQQITRHVRGRLVMVGIRYAATGERLADAVVVTADLSGARPS
ncbi:class F sortase [Nocardioides pocheonensis]|uniref:Class F sortase n=1 Tax=Nocardioides pocheonensis TaxID=661485 RepID=A0A3N0GF21_9ACTN|nr:class F sortase [Nocardioides pocheonensis]RNM11063.1 class F sortase [Nocardioides pocheonensis]